MSVRHAVAGALAALALGGAPALAEGDAKAGKKAFKRCAACHGVKEGRHKVGPSLHAIVGRPAGTLEGYDKYSQALEGSGLVWDEPTLAAFLTDPEGTVPGNTMRFRGVKEGDLANLIAYLNTLSE